MIMRFAGVLLLMLAGQPAVADAGAAPYAKVAKYRGDALAAVSLTFDDGYPGQVETAIPILDARGFRATFFVHTDNVKLTWAANWDAWRAAAEKGHEVGSHSKSHLRLTQVKSPRLLRSEIEGSADLIEQQVGVRPISFAYPFSDSNAALRRHVLDAYILDRSNCRIWGGDGFAADNGIRQIEQAVEKGSWFVCMMHGVDEVTFQPITGTAFAGIVAYLDAHRDTVWTDTYGNVGRYIRERALANVKFRSVTDAGFDVRLQLPEREPRVELLTVPLTLMIALEGHKGTEIKAYCLDKQQPTAISRDGSYVLVDVVPDGQWIQVFWGH